MRLLLKFVLFGQDVIIRRDSLATLSHLVLHSPFSSDPRIAVAGGRDPPLMPIQDGCAMDNPLVYFQNLHGLAVLAVALNREHVASSSTVAGSGVGMLTMFASSAVALGSQSSGSSPSALSEDNGDSGQMRSLATTSVASSSRVLVYELLHTIHSLVFYGCTYGNRYTPTLSASQSLQMQSETSAGEMLSWKQPSQAAEEQLMGFPVSCVYDNHVQRDLETLRQGVAGASTTSSHVSLVSMLLDIIKYEVSLPANRSEAEGLVSPDVIRLCVSLLTALLCFRSTSFESSMLKDRQHFYNHSGGVLLSQLFASFAPLEGSTVEIKTVGKVPEGGIPQTPRGEASARGIASSTLSLPEIPAFNPHRRRSSATHVPLITAATPPEALEVTKLAVTNTLMQQMCLLILQLCPTVHVIDFVPDAPAESSAAADGVKHSVNNSKGGINPARFLGKSATETGGLCTLNP